MCAAAVPALVARRQAGTDIAHTRVPQDKRVPPQQQGVMRSCRNPGLCQGKTMLWHEQVREKEIFLLSCSCPWGTLMAEVGLVKCPGYHSSSTRRRRTGKAKN